MKNIINLRSPIIEQILPGKDKCLDALTKQYQFQRTIPNKHESIREMKKRSRSSENLAKSTEKRISSGRMVVSNNQSNLRSKSNMMKSSSNAHIGVMIKDSRNSSININNDIKNLNKKSESNLHNVHGMNVDELRIMQSK